MILRMWRGRVPLERAGEYSDYQREVGPPGYRAVKGNEGVLMVGRELGDEYEITMVTLWSSWRAVRAFAGEPLDAARYYDRDFEFLIDPPDKVEHFEMLCGSGWECIGTERPEAG
ncbi:MAG: antibiotic biosynthesis monooxygenase [Thermoanaerobaculia bacterium]|nr:antibiotic biosynthesis monooxygenase [Thermoanaerobaculia bacterium]